MNITTVPKLTRKYPAAYQWTDREMGDRLTALHRRLILTADRHSEFVEDLRPIAPGKWSDRREKFAGHCPTYPLRMPRK